MAELHINVGLVALSRGFITLEVFAAGISMLAGRAGVSLRELWVGPGRMDEGQLAHVLDAVGPAKGRDTMLFSASAPPAALAHDTLLLGSLMSAEVALAPALTQPMGLGGATSAPGLRQLPMGGATAPTAPSMVPSVGAAPALLPVLAPATHELVGARYRRLFQLGAGGLGEVSACEDLVLGRTVAVKAGHGKGEVDAYSSKAILAREARIISHLEHPNIIPIYDAGTDPALGPFYVMRQVSDTSLEVILRRRRLQEGDPREYTLGRLLRYFLQVCNAVDYAHHRGVIHCDIKPANILLGEYGEVLLVDWGLAQSRSHPLGVRGGTLGYMAPEQMDPLTERFDERTDVFALGAILYEILGNVPAFSEVRNSAVTKLPHDRRTLYDRPVPPSSLPAGGEVTPELEDICLRAITVDRSERLANARLLADAIDEFIEGSKQKERQRIEADRGADAGDELAERYHEFVESRPEKMTVFRALRADVAPWAQLEDKQDLWDAEDLVRVTDALQVRTFQSAVSAYERALEALPGHARARRGLARMYFSELQRARRLGAALDEIAFEQLLREVDDGEFVRELQSDGLLELWVGDAVRQVTLATLVEHDRRLVEGSVEVLAAGPMLRRPLPAGPYTIAATFADGRTVAWPVSIEPGAASVVRLALPVADLADDEVFIPGGPARLGGDPLSTEADEPFVVDVHGFVIQRHPVTFAQWFEFIDDLRRTAPTEVALHLPRTTHGLPAWQWGPGGWVADSSLPSIVVPPDPRPLPVFGISAESAEVYARWLSARQGRAWRLPTELEWEKAGRGTDGRFYPWGNHFDATFCKMRDSRPGLPVAEPIGAFQGDVSPYGVRDLAGGVADWCTPDPRRMSLREPREVVARGGAWSDWAIDCRLASRRRYYATEHSGRVGVRLARDP